MQLPDERLMLLAKLEDALGIYFTNKSLLNQALTHSSYVNEKGISRALCYENLEFFGDSILSFIVTEDLMCKFNKNEGDLSKDRAKLVCEDSLYQIALKYNIENYMNVGGAVSKIGRHIPKSILADSIEAIIATIYIDRGLDCAKKWTLGEIKWLISSTNILAYENNEPKSKLQEYVQQKYKVLPEYRLKSHIKLDHDNIEVFHVMVYIKDKFISVGSGKNHKLAEKNAAEKALEFLDEHNLTFS